MLDPHGVADDHSQWVHSQRMVNPHRVAGGHKPVAEHGFRRPGICALEYGLRALTSVPSAPALPAAGMHVHMPSAAAGMHVHMPSAAAGMHMHMPSAAAGMDVHMLSSAAGLRPLNRMHMHAGSACGKHVHSSAGSMGGSACGMHVHSSAGSMGGAMHGPANGQTSAPPRRVHPGAGRRLSPLPHGVADRPALRASLPLHRAATTGSLVMADGHVSKHGHAVRHDGAAGGVGGSGPATREGAARKRDDRRRTEVYVRRLLTSISARSAASNQSGRLPATAAGCTATGAASETGHQGQSIEAVPEYVWKAIKAPPPSRSIHS